MSTEEEFNEALKTVEKTGDTLKIYLNDSENTADKKRKVNWKSLEKKLKHWKNWDFDQNL